MTFPLRPGHGVVVLEFVEPPDKTKGGIHLPDSARKKNYQPVGIVRAIGERIEDYDRWFSVGEHLFYRAESAYYVKHEGTVYVAVEPKALLVAIDQPPDVPDGVPEDMA